MEPQPSILHLKIYVDGASRGNPGPSALGYVIYSQDGQRLEDQGRYLGNATNNQAEYEALLAAINRARFLGAQELEIFSDSELLVRQLSGVYAVKHPTLRNLYLQVQRLRGHFRQFRVRHINREENREADALANEALDRAMQSKGEKKKD
jgi:ribonuclease HI